MKYASRQELYPVPKVFDCVVARETNDCFVAARSFDVRDVVCAARVVVDVRWIVGRAVAVDVVAREMVARLGVAEFVGRAFVFRTVVADLSVVRDVVAVAAVRDTTLRDDDDVVFVSRGPVFVVVRETASAAPMHKKHATRKDSAFLILSYNYNVIKKARFGASNIYTKK